MREKTFFLSLVTLFMVAGLCSPLALAARKGSMEGGSPAECSLHSPLRLTQTAEGHLLVSDYRLGSILTIRSTSLKVIRCFPLEGKPLGIAYARGHIYVGNETSQRIEVYNRAGKKLKKPVFQEPLAKPADLAVDVGMDCLFAVAGEEKSVKVFSLKGEFLRSFPAGDPDNPLLANPTGITVDTVNREVFVSDYGDPGKSIAPRIQVFDYQGSLVGTISGQGSGMLGQPRFSRPQGLAVDNAACVFLVDCYSSEILVLDRYSGALLKTMGGFGTEPGKLLLPLDIVIEPLSNDLYITNNRAARLEIFPEGGQL
jgi:DNA-binding beta-propeller fold protein YncE